MRYVILFTLDHLFSSTERQHRSLSLLTGEVLTFIGWTVLDSERARVGARIQKGCANAQPRRVQTFVQSEGKGERLPGNLKGREKRRVFYGFPLMTCS